MNSETSDLDSLGTTTGLKPLIRFIAMDQTTILFMNYRNAGMTPPEWLSNEDDLYAGAPQELRSMHSLHAVCEKEIDKLLELARLFNDRDSSVWVFSGLAQNELLNGLKPYLAWYARPSVLKIQFDQGSKELAKALLAGVYAVVLQVPGDERAYVYAKPEVVRVWKSERLPWACGIDQSIVVRERPIA